MDVETLAWLRSEAGARSLEHASASRSHGLADLRLAEDLRARCTADQAAATLALLDLRAHAVTKFGEDAQRMYFTRDALEQATRSEVAQHRARRLALGGCTSALDLGCGLGGDLIAMARAGLIVVGVDTDPLRVGLAQANLESLGLPGVTHQADGTTLDHSPFDVVHADPARRTGSGRTFNPEAFTPPWSYVEALLRRQAVVKLAPGLPHDLIPGHVEAEWVSWSGDLKEAVLWSGRLANTQRRATVLTPSGVHSLTEAEDPGADAVGLSPVQGYLYEPDPAVIRSGLVTAFASMVGGSLVDPNIAYVTSSQSLLTPLGRGYAVKEELPYAVKPLKAALRARDVGALTIKKRGVDVVPEQLRARLGLRGARPATLVLTRVAGKGTCLLVEPCDAPG